MGINDRPEAMSLAHRGFTEAVWRAYDMARRKRLLSTAVAATEAAHWVCAIDEQLRLGDPAYSARRDRDEEGLVILGLRYARDRAMHQVVVGSAEDTRSFYRPRRGRGILHIATSYPVWTPTEVLPPPDDRHKSDERERAYEEHVAERKVWQPLFSALRFATRELHGKVSLVAIEQPEWFEDLGEEQSRIHLGPMLME